MFHFDCFKSFGHLRPGGEGVLPSKKVTCDVPLDGAAFSQLIITGLHL